MVRLLIFAIGMIIGIGLIVFDQFETISDITGLSIIDVPIDPTTGAILGTVKFGAPIVVPFERSGTVLSADGTCETLKETITNPDGSRTFVREVVFGRIGSGDRNAEVSWHGFNGINCAYGYAEWDLTDLPNDFVATGLTLQLNLREQQVGNARCFIGFVSNTIDEIGLENLPNRMLWGDNSGGSIKLANSLGVEGNDDFLVVGKFIDFNINAKYDTDWCESLGGKSWILGKIIGGGTRFSVDIQAGVDAFNRQLQFNELTQKGNDKFTLVFYGGTSSGSGSYVIDHTWWEENGSLLVTGSSQPIRCDVGFNQVDFRCIPIVCQEGEKVDVNTNQCAPIVCGLDEELQGNICVPLVCEIGEEIVAGQCQTIVCDSGTELIGSTCDPLFCGEGFEISGNECVLKTCNIGEQLVDDNCQSIICPLNTVLIGNDCPERTCMSGQISIDNVCQDPIEIPDCDFGFKQVGDQCVPEVLDCPVGTMPRENACVPFLPDLMIAQPAELGFLTVLGIIIFAGSFFGVVGTVVRRQ